MLKQLITARRTASVVKSPRPNRTFSGASSSFGFISPPTGSTSVDVNDIARPSSGGGAMSVSICIDTLFVYVSSLMEFPTLMGRYNWLVFFNCWYLSI